MIKLFTTHCPKCQQLEKRLSAFGIKYEMITDTKTMKEKGILNVPYLEVNGKLMDFATSWKWVNEHKEITNI